MNNVIPFGNKKKEEDDGDGDKEKQEPLVFNCCCGSRVFSIYSNGKVKCLECRESYTLYQKDSEIMLVNVEDEE